MKVGYARVSTQHQELEAQVQRLQELGVDADRIYVDHGLTGRNMRREGLEKAMAAVRSGDEFVVAKLDRLARSVPDAHRIVGQLTERGAVLNVGGSAYDPHDPVGKLLFSVLAMVAEFEADLIRARTREGMAIARAKGRLKGRQPKLTPKQKKHLMELYHSENRAHTISDLAELFEVSRQTVYRAIAEHQLADIDQPD